MSLDEAHERGRHADFLREKMRFTRAGFDTDGCVGNATMQAVKNFQIKAGLQPADGYAGLKVLARLRQGL